MLNLALFFVTAILAVTNYLVAAAESTTAAVSAGIIAASIAANESAIR